MKKKFIALILVLNLAVICIAGCSKETNEQVSKVNNKSDTEMKDTKDTKAPMGRYMEKEVVLPKLEGNESIIKILQNAKKNFEVYTINATESGLEYNCYILKEDKTWEKSKPGWLNTKELTKQDSYASNMCLGSDGHYYASVEYGTKERKTKIIRSIDENSSETIKVPYLEKVASEYNGMKLYPMIEKMEVLQNGYIVLFDSFNRNNLNIFDQKGKKIDQINIGESQNYITSGNNIIVVNEKGKIIYYNTETKKIDNSIEYNMKGKFITYAVKEDGTLIVGDSQGIHRLPANSTLLETTVDGGLNTMSMPLLRFYAVYVKEGDSENYYAVYLDDKRGYHLKQYVFDANVASVPEKEITVYSLQENNTIRQAAFKFQSKNPNIKVNYVVAMDQQGGIISDYIRALNVELLSGNGADVLLLDELPVTSYIEKGILEDITDIVAPLESSGTLLSNIASNYHTDGKIYQMPIRFSVPFVLSKEEALLASDNMAGIVDYIQKNGKMKYSAYMGYADLLRAYLALNFENLVQNDQLKVNELKSFLEDIKVIANNIESKEFCYPNYGIGFSDGIDRNPRNTIFRTGYVGIGTQFATGMGQYGNVLDTILPIAYKERNKLTYSTIGNRFIPMGLVGLNSTSKERDIAKQFISYLFSEELQETNLYDGLPVLQTSLKKWFDEEDKSYGIGTSDENGKFFMAMWPEKEVRDQFYKMALDAKNPIKYNQVIYDMITEHALLYLTDKEDINQATTAINSKVNTYLAE